MTPLAELRRRARHGQPEESGTHHDQVNPVKSVRRVMRFVCSLTGVEVPQ